MVVKMQTLGVIVGDNEGSLRRIVQINLTEPVVNRPPNSLIFSFSSGVLSAPNAGGRVLPLRIYPYPTDISHRRT